jgi:D-arginine dehydrogenase
MAELPASVDVVVVGAGIAGASAGDALARAGLSVAVLEAEDRPGRHATGRSAAHHIPSYGPPPVQALTAAATATLAEPPGELVTGPLLRPRPVLSVAAPGGEAALAAARTAAERAGTPLADLDPSEAVALFPALRPELVAAATLDARAADLDVDALHQLHLRRLRRAGGTVVPGARVTAIARAGSGWAVTTGGGTGGTVRAGLVVDAAGAWGDQVAALAGVEPVGLAPLRRTAFLVAAPPGSAGWPLAADAAEAWYAKPDAGRMLCSPADETPAPPGDARPDEVDVARALDVLRERTTLATRSVARAWAGLRTFAPDRVPVVGRDPEHPGFVWCVGQGGYGVQTAPAVGDLVAALVTGAPPPVAADVVAALDPARLRR